ncbi:MAG: hypothetical protein HFI35_11325 [Roseburia sp.]|nr:hypothetical protein [Roseburia sp.]
MRKKTAKGGDSMGMTNKQFQGFLRLALELLERALQKSPDNEDLKKVRDIFQSMLEDDETYQPLKKMQINPFCDCSTSAMRENVRKGEL